MDPDDPLVRLRPTLNPYRLAAGLFIKRAIWDCNPKSWISRQRLKGWRNTHLGKKAVILCNGPSLLNSDLGLLNDTFTFGLNKINLLFDKSDFRPSCIVSVNRLVLEQNAPFFNETKLPLFLDSYGTRFVRLRDNTVFLHAVNHRAFAKDCSQGVYQGHTVTFVALQLAFQMGFSEVALIGADHNFAAQGPANKEVVSGDRDESHFDPNYFANGVKWDLPDLFESEVSFTMAKNIYEAYDRRIINATEGGKLEIFPRASLAGFLESD